MSSNRRSDRSAVIQAMSKAWRMSFKEAQLKYEKDPQYWDLWYGRMFR